MKSLSIIIPCYNCLNWIDRNLNILLNNSSTLDFEIILVDDGSTDDTYKHLKNKYGINEKINIIRKNNGGVSSARNIGIKAAKKQFITFIDSDDFVEEEYFLKIEEILNHYEADWFIFGFNKYFDKNNKKSNSLIKQTKFVTEKEIKKMINSELINSPWNKVYNTDLITKNNIIFDEDVSIGEDYLFNMTYMKYSNKIMYVDKCIYNYVINANDNSLTKRINKNKLYQLNKVDENIAKMYKNQFEKEIQFIRIKHLYSCLIDYINYGDKNQTNKVFALLKNITPKSFLNFLLVKGVLILNQNTISFFIKKYERRKNA